MTTWAQAIRHPWFNPPTMKRRLSANDDGDDDSSCSYDVSSSTFSARLRKRVRYNSLERTLAHMTLGSALATGTSEDVDMWPKTSPPRPRVQETSSVVLPSEVEEPGMPASESVDMEVEPILVTTDTSITTHALDDWESIESEQLDIKEVQISSAVLECLKRQTKCPLPLIPLPSQTSQALVLYRTPRPPSPKPMEPACDHQEGKGTHTSILVTHEDDVMEVE